jgi:hypothetical protein
MNLFRNGKIFASLNLWFVYLVGFEKIVPSWWETFMDLDLAQGGLESYEYDLL